MAWLLGIPVGVAVAVLILQWALRSHRRDRKPWLDLLDVRTTEAADGAVGAIDGLASDGGGELAPLEAPFSRRKCIAFHIELITREAFANAVTWRRVFQDGVGQLVVVSPTGERRGRVDLRGARVILPTPLEAYNKLSVGEVETIFHGPLQAAPPHLAWFVQQLPREVQQALFGAQRIFFNERIIVPGQNVVAAGEVTRNPGGVDLLPAEGFPVCFGLGTIESERARVAKLPVGGELFGAIVVGGFVGGATMALIAALHPQ